MSESNKQDKGNRRVRLLLWKLYYQTPLNINVEEWVERGAALSCKLTWPEYCELKARYPALWQRWANKRSRAQQAGKLPLQPPQLRRYRRSGAKQRAFWRKQRPRFAQWAANKLARQRTYKKRWRRHLVLDRLLVRSVGL